AMAETLEGAALADQGVARDFVARIHREADRMADLVSDLLMLSRIEAGLAVRYPERLALGDLVIAIVSDFEERARSKQIEITTAVPIDLPTVLGDAGQLRVLVGNLLDNAIKFTPVGGHIVVRAWEAAGAIHVAVEDTGLGIAEEHLSHVFERFYKADRSRSDAGTGLGLSIARHVVKAHGGMIAVRRNVGSGTTFEFSIPVTLDP
ncbi:MAG: HAMP domain-containing sensor histidine kinase, partial [Chloroflexi bacterium]|nr:HAMP domain-containing sensor histidine kinase [Chloroflexota bacterium]